MHLGNVKNSDTVACGCAKGDNFTLLSMAEALCEAEWVEQGIKGKRIRCFGVDGHFLDCDVDDGNARASIAVALEHDDDTMVADMLQSACL